jgi:predicted SAM-dependent methyltransferase
VKLHIGGQVRRDGWTVVDIQPGPAVDIVGDATALGAIADGAAQELYASHVLEHLGFDDVPRALAEWHRVLAPGGRLMVSVPDLAKLGPALAHPQLTSDARQQIIAMIYGGQTDPHDFHKWGFTAESLGRYLKNAGFAEIMRVEQFGLFEDSSAQRLGPALISLNLIARKPPA